MEFTTYIQCTISSITHVHPSSELKVHEIGRGILYSIQSFFKALYLTVFLQFVPRNICELFKTWTVQVAHDVPAADG